MSSLWPTPAWWLVHVALGGGLLLLCTALLVRRLRQPARRQRVAEWGIVASLLLAVLCLAPSWLNVPLLTPEPTPVVAETPPPAPQPEPSLSLEEALAGLPDAGAVVDVEPSDEPPLLPGEERPAAVAPAPETAVEKPEPVAWLLPAVCTIYFIGVLYFLARLAWGHRQLARFLASAVPVPPRVRQLFVDMGGDSGVRLLTSEQARMPISCGVLRPTIVLPTVVCEACNEAMLRWVLAHELAHLRRGDARTTLLFGLARAVYFFLPWFWWLHRQVRLCQEYVADAAAVAGSETAAEYAEFLLNWSAAPAVPAGASGVSGQPSDLFRRITMLVHNPLPIEERCPRRWSLLAGAGLLSLAILVAGVGLGQAAPTPDDKDKNAVKKDEPKKDDTKKDDTKKDDTKKDKPKKDEDDPLPGFPEIDDLMKRFGGLDEETAKLLRQQLEMTRKMLEQMRKQGAGGPLPNLAPQLPGGGILPIPLPQIRPINPRLNRIMPNQGMTEPRLGVRLEKPSATIVDQLDLPRDQGLIVQELNDSSAAAKAGVKQHDILLELGGKPVPSDPQGLHKLMADIKPDEAVDAVVMRKSKKETIKGLKLPRATEQPNKNNPFRLEFFPPAGGLNLNGLNGFNGLANSVSITRNNDSFTMKAREGEVRFSIQGKIEDGKPVPTEITVEDGGKSKSYDSVDKVPEEHRQRVKDLMQMLDRAKVRTFRIGR